MGANDIGITNLQQLICRKGHVTTLAFSIRGFGTISGDYCNTCLEKLLEPLKVKPLDLGGEKAEE